MLRDRQAVESLIHCLEDDDIEVRASAASTLGWIGDSRAIDPLLGMLENPHWRLRQSAAYALGEIGDQRALDAIRKHLDDPKKRVRKAVKSALAKFHRKQQANKSWHPTTIALVRSVKSIVWRVNFFR